MFKSFPLPAFLRRTPSEGHSHTAGDRWVERLLEQRLAVESEGRQLGRTSDNLQDGLIDLRVASPGEPRHPGEVFDRLRWGGYFATIDTNYNKIAELQQKYDNANGFVVEQPLNDLWHAPLGIRIPGITPRAWAFVARKTELVRPDEDSKRSTYDVVLTRDENESEGFCVTKRVPSVEGVLRRINARFPGLDPVAAKQRARKLVGDVFSAVSHPRNQMLGTPSKTPAQAPAQPACPSLCVLDVTNVVWSPDWT